MAKKNQVDFCYRLTEEAKMAYDTKTGEPTEAYLKFALTLGRLPNETEYKRLHEALRHDVARMLDLPIDYIIPISFLEYAENVNEEGSYNA